MISCILKGGLGNQLFQIAATISYAIDTKQRFAFDYNSWGARGGAAKTFQASHPTSYRETLYKYLPEANLATKTFGQIYKEPSFHYKQIPVLKDVILDGYFQSEKYFSNNEDVIRKVFYPYHLKRNLLTQKYQIPSGTQVVGIHVRRGEYLKDQIHHPVCTKEYYEKCIGFFRERNPNVEFLIISDDILWCQEHFEGMRFSVNDTDIEDLYDLILCDHNIIANSTFSWWAAWLNDNPEKTILSPNKWFGEGYKHFDTKDITPTTWIKM